MGLWEHENVTSANILTSKKIDRQSSEEWYLLSIVVWVLLYVMFATKYPASNDCH
jgi:hypothetical protein